MVQTPAKLSKASKVGQSLTCFEAQLPFEGKSLF